MVEQIGGERKIDGPQGRLTKAGILGVLGETDNPAADRLGKQFGIRSPDVLAESLLSRKEKVRGRFVEDTNAAIALSGQKLAPARMRLCMVPK